jgi:P27 family predicted phage terminase small subunit
MVRRRRRRTPEPPEGLRDEIRDRWVAYWKTDAALLVEDSDMAVVRRLFVLYDQHARAMDIVTQALAVKGSMGQIRVNPLADHALKLEAQILRLESELALTPMARARLGIDVLDAAKPQEKTVADELRAKRAERQARAAAE